MMGYEAPTPSDPQQLRPNATTETKLSEPTSVPQVVKTSNGQPIVPQPQLAQCKPVIISCPMTPPRAISLFAEHGRESFFKMYANPRSKK